MFEHAAVSHAARLLRRELGILQVMDWCEEGEFGCEQRAGDNTRRGCCLHCGSSAAAGGTSASLANCGRQMAGLTPKGRMCKCPTIGFNSIFSKPGVCHCTSSQSKHPCEISSLKSTSGLLNSFGNWSGCCESLRGVWGTCCLLSSSPPNVPLINGPTWAAEPR